MNLKVFGTNSILSTAVFAVTVFFTTQASARAATSESDLNLVFEASIDRVNGITQDLMPESLSIGAKITGEISIENSIQIDTPTLLPGEGFYWGRKNDGKPVTHVLFDAPVSSNFEYSYFGVQKSAIRITCPPLFCEFSGELKTNDGTQWNVDYLSLQATQDIDNLEMELRDATDLLKEVSANGGAKMILRYVENSAQRGAIRIILTLTTLEYQ
jgi:hypothetical protein